MAAGYSEDQIQDFTDSFSLFDTIGDGKINISQVGDALRALGQNPTEAEVKKCCQQRKPDDRISFDVFLPILQTVTKNRSTETVEDFVEGIRHFDNDGNGYISSPELRHLLTTLGEKLSDEEVDVLFAGREEAQGINYEEFVRMVMSG